MDGFGVLLWKYLDAIQTGPNDDCPCAASQVVDVEKALPRAAPRVGARQTSAGRADVCGAVHLISWEMVALNRTDPLNI